MKATVRASDLSKAMKASMKNNSSSPRLIFNDDGIFVACSTRKAIRVEESDISVDKTGWSYIERDRAQRIVQLLDIMEGRMVTLSYEGNWVRFVDLLL